jgi:hypothetical protein
VSTPYTAKSFEHLCIIAIREGGFLDCDSLRQAPGNGAYTNAQIKKGERVNIPDKQEKESDANSENKYKYKQKNSPIPSIHFVRSKQTAWGAIAAGTLIENFLQISNFPTNKCGANYDKDFPSTFGFNENAEIDRDVFQVEVIDYGAKTNGKTQVDVKLEALKPVYKPDGKINTWESFKNADTADKDKCNITIVCKQVANGIRYRSKYIRLVVDEDDYNSVPAGQALLVPDIADGAEGDKDKVEILDQWVRATYALESCPKAGDAKCKVVAQLPVGEDKQRIKLAVHILRQSRGGNGVVTIAEARKNCLNVIRKVSAQAGLSIKFVDPKIRLVQPPTNMLIITDSTGPGAEGGKKHKVKIKIKDSVKEVEKTYEYTTVRDELPEKTAENMAGGIIALFTADFADLKVKHIPNPTYQSGATVHYTADVLIGDPEKHEVTIRLLVNPDKDSNQKLKKGEILTTQIVDFGNDDSHVGTAHERVLMKNYDSGKDRIDFFVVGTLAGAYGESFWPRNFTKKDKASVNKNIDQLVNSVILCESVVKTPRSSYKTITHELGHVLMDIGNHTPTKTELMFAGEGDTVRSEQWKVNGPKRISDLDLAFDDGDTHGSSVTFMRDNNSEVIDDW